MFVRNIKMCILCCALLIESLQAMETSPIYQYYHTTKYTVAKEWLQQLMPSEQTRRPSQQLPNKLNDGNEPFTMDATNHSPLLKQSPLKAFIAELGSNVDSSTINTRAEEGAFCKRSFDGRSGYCILAYQCLHVIREYRVHGTKIDICTYRRNIPVICCPLADKHTDEQRISAKKCQEYHEAVRNIKFSQPRSFSGKLCVPSVPMIVGGEITRTGDYPHMAALGWTQSDNVIKWGCGGTLVSEFFILTAAHCATSGSKPPDVARLGTNHLNKTSNTQQDMKILIIILHPKYKSTSYYHDIALLKLTKRAKLSQSVRPACLWQLPELEIKTGIAAGWGRTGFLGQKSEKLQHVDLNLIEQKVCQDLYRQERRLPRGIIDNQFCAGHLEGGKDTCQGDSGGPLHAELPEYNCVKFVIGITSFGKFCAAANAPGVYTKVYAYLDWIERIVFLHSKRHRERNPIRRGYPQLPVYRHPHLTVNAHGRCHAHDQQFSGYCTRYADCSSAVNAWQQQQIQLVYCYFTPFESTVCCPDIHMRRSEKACKGYYTHREDRKKHKHRREKRADSERTDKVDTGIDEAIEELITKENHYQIDAVGGIATTRNEFPFMCALGWKSKSKQKKYAYHCGCVLVAKKFVLTVAHCTSLGGESPLIVRLGDGNINEQHGEILKIKKIITHPGYRKEVVYDDIAIIILEENARKRPACLWTVETLPHEQLTAIGYGQTKFAGPSSDELLKVYLKVMTNQDCSKFYSGEVELIDGIGPGQICAADEQKVMDTCQGDSGGPLVMSFMRDNITYPYIVGLTSFGKGCATGIPSIYTRISHYLDWIEQIIWEK